MKRSLASDKYLLGLVLLSAVLGCFVVWDASFAGAMLQGEGLIPRKLLKHVIGMGIGLIAFLILSSRSPAQLRKWSAPFFWVMLVLCILVLVPALGHDASGAQRRLGGETIGFQPAELMKPAAIFFLALAALRSYPDYTRRANDWIAKLDGRILPFMARLAPLMCVGLAFVLVEKEPDLGTALVILSIAGGMLLFGLADKLFGKRAIAVCCVLVVVCGLGVTVMARGKGYRADRMATHSSRWDAGIVDGAGHQSAMAERNMAYAGPLGIGIGKGLSKQGLPAATTDYVFVTIAEEFGIIGSFITIALLAGTAFRLLYLANSVQDEFSRLIVQGTGWWIGTQSIFNLLVAGAAIPSVGIPLPFFSEGISSLLALGIALGACRSALTLRPSKETLNATRGNRRRHRRPRLSRA